MAIFGFENKLELLLANIDKLLCPTVAKMEAFELS